MATALDKSLDDIISSRPKTGRRRLHRGARAANNAVKPGSAAGVARARYSDVVPTANGNRVVALAPTPAAQPDATKIIVSNLPTDVNEAQIRELFVSTVGPLREVNLHYDAKGNSKGTASAIFTRKGDGNKAFSQYNNRLIDGKRPMKIEIVMDPAKPPTLSQRVAPAPAPAAPVVPVANGTVTASGPKPRRRHVRGRGRRKGDDRPTKSVADLDAEMEDYSNATSGPTAAAA